MRKPLKRRFDDRVDAFLSDPASPRKATQVMVALTVLTVLAGSVVIWLFDREEDFPDFATALWFTLQTVTTVGYGDVTPETWLGRAIAGVVMVVAIAFMAIVTALVTSTFVDAAQARRRRADAAAQEDASDRVHGRLDEVIERLTAIEARLDAVDRSESPPGPPPSSTTSIDPESQGPA
jgi:voltage-gated potassium channel